MPELPEVETVVRGLSKVLPDLKISSIDIHKPKMWQGLEPESAIGRKITKVERVSKVTIIHLDGDLAMMIHLKMTGQLIYVKGDQRVAGGHPDEQMTTIQPSKYSHIIFSFTNGSRLYFNDMRQFGYIKLVKESELQNQKQVTGVGIEPLDDRFSLDYLKSVLKKKQKSNIKQTIMDQSLISGLGNIYANESLFLAGVLPSRLSGSISDVEAKKLHTSTIEVLRKAISLGGTSYKDYVNHEGKKGTMQEELMVYGRKGLPCKICGTPIERVAMGGRGTYYCGKCQV